MSVVTDVVLVTGVSRGFEDGVKNPNRWLETNRSGFEGGWGTLTRVDESAGGTKVMQGNVYLGAFNHFNTDGFVAAIRAEKWPYWGVRLLVQEEFADDWEFIDPWRDS